MARLKCRLLSHSARPHVQQLHTGFKMLADQGLIELTQTFGRPVFGSPDRPQHLKNATDAHLRVELTTRDDRTLRLYFDNHDSQDIDRAHLQACDLYFKRSYRRDYVSGVHARDQERIHPLGLYYFVLPNEIDPFSMRRHLALGPGTLAKKLEGVLESLDAGDRARFHPRLRHLHALPDYSLPPKVLFMVTAYDPHDSPDRAKEKVEEMAHTNETRAACIRALRKELGPRFYGGFVHNRFTTANYPDLLVDRPENTKKARYLRLLAEFPICIATTGLHGSIGGKFAEYVAFSKAIVSEELNYEVPGPLAPNRNYLAFSTPDECVEQSLRLMNDHDLRKRLMSNNLSYYTHYGKPDMLVLNALTTAMKHWSGTDRSVAPSLSPLRRANAALATEEEL